LTVNDNVLVRNIAESNVTVDANPVLVVRAPRLASSAAAVV
jgi:hypothetical protein